MPDPSPLLEKFSALKKLGVGEFAHLSGSLESHLLGTYNLLVEWDNPGYVCDAGLYHAVYGTQPLKKLGIPHREYSPSDRPRIREIIGEESERLVYLYGACDRDFFYPQIGLPQAKYRDRFTGIQEELPPDTLKALLEITLANELEICKSDPSFKEKNRSGYISLFDRFQGWVSVKAGNRYKEVFQLPDHGRPPSSGRDNLVFRETLEKDIEPTFSVRASTRQNPVSISQLHQWGFTPESVWKKYSTGEFCGWVCEDNGKIAGFCSGDIATGEVIVLAVLPQYEGYKIGKRLLSLLVRSMQEKGCSSLWLSASPDPEIRAHGFYRANGWVPNGEVLENGDEILVFRGLGDSARGARSH